MSTLYLRVLEKWINANFRLPSAAISSVKRGGLPQFLLSWLETGLQGLILPGQRRAVLSGVQRLPRLLRSTGLERGSCCAGSRKNGPHPGCLLLCEGYAMGGAGTRPGDSVVSESGRCRRDGRRLSALSPAGKFSENDSCCAGSIFRLLLEISAAKAAAPFPVKAACAFFDSLQSRSSFKLNSLPSAETAAAGPFGAEAPAPTAAETAAASPSGAEAPTPTAAETAAASPFAAEAPTPTAAETTAAGSSAANVPVSNTAEDAAENTAPDCLVRIEEGVSFFCCAGTWDLPFLKTTRRLYIAGPAVNTRLYSAVSHSFRELVRLIDRRR